MPRLSRFFFFFCSFHPLDWYSREQKNICHGWRGLNFITDLKFVVVARSEWRAIWKSVYAGNRVFVLTRREWMVGVQEFLIINHSALILKQPAHS